MPILWQQRRREGTQNTVTDKILQKKFHFSTVLLGYGTPSLSTYNAHIPFFLLYWLCTCALESIILVLLAISCTLTSTHMKKKIARNKQQKQTTCIPVLMVPDALAVQCLGVSWLATSEGGVPVEHVNDNAHKLKHYYCKIHVQLCRFIPQDLGISTIIVTNMIVGWYCRI